VNLKATLSTDKDTFYRKATIRNYRFVSMYRLGGLAGSPEIEIFGGVGLGRYDHGAYKWARIQSDCSVYTLRLRFWMERKSRTGKFHSTEEVVGAGDNPVFSVIVPHYHDLHGLDRCLTALSQQTYPSERFEVIVADNDSPEGIDAVVNIIAGRAQIVVVKERGPGLARNGGVTKARGRYLAFTDSDCVPEPQWLAEGLTALRKFDFVGGEVNVIVSDPKTMSPTEAFERIFAFPNETYVKRDGFSVTANLFCPRSLFDRVGGFKGLRIAEDSNWCFRARDAGFVIGYSPSAAVGHPARVDWNNLLKKWRLTNLNNFGLTKEKKWGRFRWAGRTLLLPISALAHTPKVLLSNRIQGFNQRLMALRVLYRLRLWRFFDAIRLLFAEA
jgi:glycosyltransferase involved in cell wall biosynthesis